MRSIARQFAPLLPSQRLPGRKTTTMAFFKRPPPPPPRPERIRLPEWYQQDNNLGQLVPIQFVLARSSKTVIAVLHLVAYPNGFEFRLAALVHPDVQSEDSMLGVPVDHTIQSPTPTHPDCPTNCFASGSNSRTGRRQPPLRNAASGSAATGRNRRCYSRREVGVIARDS